MYLSGVFIGCSCCFFNPCKLPLAAVGGWVLFKANCLSFCGSFWSIRFVYSTRNKFYLIGCFRLHTKFVCSIISVLCLQTLFVLLMCTNNCVSNLYCINWLTGNYQLLVLGNVVILFTKLQISNCLYTTSLLYNVIPPMSFALCRDMCITCTSSRFLPPCVHICTVYACIWMCACICVWSILSSLTCQFHLSPHVGSWAASRSRSVWYTYIFQTHISETGDGYAHILWCLSVQGKYNALGCIQISQQKPEWPNHFRAMFCTCIFCQIW